MKKQECVMCNQPITQKNTVGINKKLLGTDIKKYYCLDCLAEYLEVSVEDIMDKIEEFKADGCKLFE